MSLTYNLIINAYAMMILLIIFLHSLRSAEKNLLHHKLFMSMLLSTALMLVVDILSRLDGYPGTLYAAANAAGNFAIFLLNPLLPSLWLLYVCCQLSACALKMRRRLGLLAAFNGLYILMLVLSQFFGWFYTISPDNVYRRGPLFFVPVAVTAILLIFSYALIFRYRKNVDNKRFLWLLLFPLPTIAGVVLQVVFYGFSFSCSGAALSAAFAFVTLQNDSLNTDYLTGIYNRKGLEKYIQQKINSSTKNRTFSGILLDLDNFKAVNDTFGHSTGDAILKAAAELLKSCFQPGEFIARFGGDEFVVILNVSDPETLEKTAAAVRDCFARYADNHLKPLTLDVSIGYAVYDANARLSAEEFLKKIDDEMYHHKRAGRKSEQGHLPDVPDMQARPAVV